MTRMRLFAYRLALALGIWDVRGMLEDMSCAQFMEWAEYHCAEPWGEERADLRSAIAAWTTATAFGGRKSHVKVIDFMPKFGSKKPKRQTREEMQSFLKAFCKSFKGGRA